MKITRIRRIHYPEEAIVFKPNEGETLEEYNRRIKETINKEKKKGSIPFSISARHKNDVPIEELKDFMTKEEHLYFDSVVTASREQAKEYDSFPVNLHVSNEVFFEITQILKLYGIPFKPIKNGIEINILDKQ